MGAEEALRYARDHRGAVLDELKALLRIPSISTLPEHAGDMRHAADTLASRLRSLGFEVEVVEGEGHPVVYGEWLNAPGRPTVLLYGHYDVQPADPIDLWTSPPFEPEVRDGNVYARGAADDKGQVMTMIAALDSYQRTVGRLPLNVKIIIEGEEEAGGAAVEAFIRRNPERLRAEFAQVADSGMFAPGVPTLETGLRGNVYTEVHARGAAHDLHSGLYGGVAPNPLNALGHIIAGLKDREGRITIPGFYDDVVMPDDAVLRSWRELPFDEEAMLRDEVGSSRLVGEGGYTVLERTWARPTLDVHGIPGGFTDAGTKTVIPAEASAKISMRIVPNQTPERIYELFRQRVLALGSPGIELEVVLHSSGRPVVVSSESRWLAAARKALHATFGREAVLGRSGGSIPIVALFGDALGLETVLMGWGLPDDNLHAPNEKFSLDNLHAGTDATIRFWEIIAT